MEHCTIAGISSGRVFKQLLGYCALFCSCARIALPDEGLQTEALQKKMGLLNQVKSAKQIAHERRLCNIT